MLLSLRMLALQKVASEFGYNRIVLGSCISRIASHGQGYSLPADIQYVDARWEIPVVLPLRDCFAQEINMFCHLDSLKTIKLSTGPSSSINSLVSSFVTLLQEENPSRESTIVRTAGKLIPFHFNRIPEIIEAMFHWQLEDAKRDIISNPMNLFLQNPSVLSAIARLTKVKLLIGAITITAKVATLFILLAVQVVSFRYFHQIPHRWRNFTQIYLIQWLPGQTKSTMVN
ncbi:hypothetical protein P8452_18221 [Trifolium repens]|nr:hypothetical protein P8452_18221 [Trifolium repens]